MHMKDDMEQLYCFFNCLLDILNDPLYGTIILFYELLARYTKLVTIWSQYIIF